MPAIVYPLTLPEPAAGWGFTLRERAARSSIAGNPQARRRTSDMVADIESVQWTYGPEDMPTWRTWFNTTLVDGQLWFTAKTPGAGGPISTRVMRFRPGSVKVVPLGAGLFRVTAQLEMRGRSLPPTT